MYPSEKRKATIVFNSRRTPTRTLNNFLATLCLIISPSYCLATPYMDSVHVLKDSWNTIAYGRVVWPDEDSSTVICYSALDCMLNPCMLSEGSSICASDMDETSVHLPYGATMKQAREEWVKYFGTVSKLFRFRYTSQTLNKTRCLTIASSFAGNKQLPGMECVKMPPINVTCSITEQLDISYNTLTADKVNNAEAYGTLNVLCSDWTSVRLQLVGPSEIDLGRAGTLTASLHIGGRDLANSYSFQGLGQTTSLKVTSILHSSRQEAEAGSFQGQGIIIMQIN